MALQQNSYIWIIPSKERKELILQPKESVSIPFVECMDGGYSYDVWVVSADTSTRYYGMRVNEKQLYSSMKIKGEEGWQMLGNLWVAKGEHMMTITNASDEVAALDAILVTRNGGFISSGVATKHLEQIKCGADPDELLEADGLIGEADESDEARYARLQQLYDWGFTDRLDQDISTGNGRCGVPMGGIGAGKIELDEHGIMTAITINHNYELPIYRTDASMFAAYAKVGDTSEAMVLQDENISCNDLPLCDSIDFLGRFPRAELTYKKKDFPVNISLSAFSPLIERDEAMSSIPAFTATFTVQNPNEQEAEAAIMFSMENLLGIGGSMVRQSADENRPSVKVMNTWNAAYTVYDRSQSKQEADGETIRFVGGNDIDPSYKGEYCMLCDKPVSVCASFEGTDMSAVWAQFAKDGTLPENQPVSEKPAGAMSAKVSLKPGETKKITFVFAWYLPVYLDAKDNDWSVYYVNHFGSAKDVATFVMGSKDRLYEKTVAYEEKLFGSDLPVWLKEKLLNDRFPVYTCSIFTKDGRFSINEAPTGMMGCLGTMDQRLASQIYYSNFFPVLDKTEISLFANIQGEDGSIPHDIGNEYIYTEPHTGTWSDLCSSFVLQVYRNAITNGDKDFLTAMYPQIKRAVKYQQSIDYDNDGIPDVGAGHGTTYDTYHWYGCCAFVASLWLAELRCCMRIAEMFGDVEYKTECEAMFERAQKSMIEKLWTTDYAFGGFFRNYKDTVNGKESNNSFIAQLAGVWFAESLDLGDILPAEIVDEAFATIGKRNLHCRDIKLMSDETTPEGDSAWFGYTFVQYDEQYYACPTMRRGYIEDGMEVYRRVASLPNPWNIGLTYFNDGKFMGLPYYMTNPASYSIIEALSGFLPDVIRGVLQLSTICEVENLPLCSPKFEGLLTVKGDDLILQVTRVNAAFTGIKLTGFTACTVNSEPVTETEHGFAVGDKIAVGDIIEAKRI